MRREERVLRKLSLVGPTTIVAGHYCLSPELSELSHAGESELASFRFGARLHGCVRASGHPSRLVLWVNDIGCDPALRNALKRDREIPAGYREVLDEAEVSPVDVEMLFESTTRNRASAFVRKQVRRYPERFGVESCDQPGLVRCVEQGTCGGARRPPGRAYTLGGPDGERLVLKDGPNPRCNVILAALFDRLEQAYPGRHVVNMFNAVYRARIALGVHVARVLFDSKQPYTNLFFDGAQLVDLGGSEELKECSDGLMAPARHGDRE